MGGPERQFPPTSWTLLAKARRTGDPDYRTHMGSLLTRYWKPVFAYVQSRRRNVEEAKDLTQDFFTRLLEKGHLDRVDRARGSFRGFLRSALHNFLVDAGRRERARRPAGKRFSFPVEEIRDLAEATDPNEEPRSRFEREWKRTVISTALAGLERRLRKEGRGDYHKIFREYCLPDETWAVLAGRSTRVTLQALADREGIAEATVRKRLAYVTNTLLTILREEIRKYALEEEDVEKELRALTGRRSGSSQ